MPAPKPTTLAATLRGSLPATTLGARDLMRIGKNILCQRLSAITLVGSSPAIVAHHIFGQPHQEEQSPFAISKGDRFERIQTENGATRLITTLIEEGILGPGDVSVRDIRAETSGMPKTAARQRAIKLTDDILRMKATGSPDAPAVVIQPALPIRIGANEVIVVRPDAFIAKQSESMYRDGEIKSYAFLHHYTDPHDVGQAAAQCGVYAMAKERRLEELRLPSDIPTEDVIVLVKVGSLHSVARLQEITRDRAIARRIIDIRPQTLHDVQQMIGKGNTLDNERAIIRLQPHYDSRCRAFCPMHHICRAEAQAQGNPAILGDDAVELLADGSCNLIRVEHLMRGAPPANSDEIALLERLRWLDQQLRGAS